MRLCARDGCTTTFPTPHGGHWPVGYCSEFCHRNVKTPPTRLKRAQLRAVAPATTRRPVSEASPVQRAVIRERACVVCGQHAGACHPAHIIPRGVTSIGQDDPRAVCPLCPLHHRLYDEGGLSILEFLEPRWRVELAFAVERVGLLSTLRRVTNDREAA
jgi:ferredoxin